MRFLAIALLVTSCVSTPDVPTIKADQCGQVVDNFTALTPEDKVEGKFAMPLPNGVMLVIVKKDGDREVLFLSGDSVPSLANDKRTVEQGKCFHQGVQGFYYYGKLTKKELDEANSPEANDTPVRI